MKSGILLKYAAAICALLFIMNGCAQESPFLLSPEKFASAIAAPGKFVILDVRTPDEFKEGHIDKAVNYDWNGDHFFDQIKGIGKKEPVYVYCFSGGRSGEAAKAMREKGFLKVYELQGGIRKWRMAGLPEGKGAQPEKGQGMSRADFDAMLNTDKAILVDFYADWCVPCKKLKPILYQISKERSDVVVMRINADENRSIAKELNIQALPTLLLYKQKNLTWRYEGLISKQEILSQIK